MNTKSLFALFLLFTVSIMVSSCEKDEIKPLSLYNDYCEVPVNGNTYIGIKTGNKDYILRVENPQIIEAEMDWGWSDPTGMIEVYAKEKGETKLFVTDNITKETCEINIRVTDNYIAYFTERNDHPALSEVPYVYLLNNNAKDAYFLDRQSIGNNDYKIYKKAQGKYEFNVKDGKRYLTLIYASDSNGKLTDAAIAPTEHEFLITEKTNQEALYKLDVTLGLNWGISAPNGIRTSPAPTKEYMEIEETGTEYKVAGRLEPYQIPEGIMHP